MSESPAEDRYSQRGVSSSKSEVHAVVDKLDHGLFPGAFCKVTEDSLTGNPDSCCVIHSDGAGTKSILGYLHYRETGDPGVFRGIAQDSIVMNVDDLACIGVTENIIISSTVNRNARNFPGEALAALIEGTEEFWPLCGHWAWKSSVGGAKLQTSATSRVPLPSIPAL